MAWRRIIYTAVGTMAVAGVGVGTQMNVNRDLLSSKLQDNVSAAIRKILDSGPQEDVRSREVANRVLLRLAAYERNLLDAGEEPQSTSVLDEAQGGGESVFKSLPSPVKAASAEVLRTAPDLPVPAPAVTNAERAAWKAEKEKLESDLAATRLEMDAAKNQPKTYGPLTRVETESEVDSLKKKIEEAEAKLQGMNGLYEERARFMTEADDMRSKINALAMEKAVLEKDMESSKISQRQSEFLELEQTKRDLASRARRIAKLEEELQEVVKDRDRLRKREKGIASDASYQMDQLARVQGELQRSERENDELRSRLDNSQNIATKSNDCQVALLDTKNQLLLARTTLSELTNRVPKAAPAPAADRIVIPPQRVAAPVAPPARVAVGAAQQPAARASLVAEPPLKSDVLIVAVTVPKASLRSGPGEQNSSVMEISRGNRLTVEERIGNWYRVLTPTGSRAYIRSDVVTTDPESIPVASRVPVRPKAPVPARRIDDDTVTAPVAASTAPSPQSQDAKAQAEQEAQRALETLMHGLGGGGQGK